MKVRTGFTFDEEQLRTVRATLGRSGRATRVECLTFIDRAIRTALDAAPTPKRRTTRTKGPKPFDRPSFDEPTDIQTSNGRIRNLYRTEARA